MKVFTFLFFTIFFVSCTAQPTPSMIQTEITKTEMAMPTQTPTRKIELPKPTSTPKQPDCDDQISINNDWETVYCDNFNFDSGWGSSDSNDLVKSIYQVENGKLVVDFTGKNTQGFMSGVVHWYTFAEESDFTVSLKGKIISKFENATWGINFRGSGADFYSFMVSNNGQYWLQQLKSNKWDDLIRVRAHNTIKWDEENELIIVCEGDSFDFYINGTLINSYESSALSGKEISLSIWTAEGVIARFEFDDIVVKQK